MKLYKVKRPNDKRIHQAQKFSYKRSNGQISEHFEIIKPFHLGYYTRAELEIVED